jgi:hypothetical protein
VGNYPFSGSTGGSAAPSIVIGPSGDQTGAGDKAKIVAAVAALPTPGGTVYLQPGMWYLKPGALVINMPDTQSVMIDGQSGAIINAVAGTAGDVIWMYDSTVQSGGPATLINRPGIRGVTIDGTNAAAGSTGLHIGDLSLLDVDVIVQNFSGAGSIGIHLDNTVSWTEECDIRATVINSTSNVVFEVTTGWNSFAYNNIDFTIFAGANQDGVVLKNGAYLYNGGLRIRGNFNTSGSPVTSAVVRLTGVSPVGTPTAGQPSRLFAEHVDWQVECDGSSGNSPTTVYIDSGTSVEACYGIMNFLPATVSFTPSNINVTTNTNPYQWQGFNGIIGGDANLSPGSADGSGWTAAGPLIYTQAAAPVFSNVCYPPSRSGDFFAVPLTGNTTISLNYSGGEQAGAQKKTFIISQPATGGTYTYTVTWPHTATPSLTSPTVQWTGGTPPVMTTGAGATDMYELTTLDGITWVGRATQHVS